MKLLVTGAAGKVGRQFIDRFLGEERFAGATVRAFCHHRLLEEGGRLEVVRGSLADRDAARAAMVGVTHVVHLATCKETPDDIMDVTVKGLFWLLEEARGSSGFKQFILIGGDAGMGHFFYRYDEPITEAHPHRAYPGCYALSKVLEEVLLEQYYIQYDLNGCCLRAPWIMEKDDFKYSLSFGEDVFGGPRWMDLVGESEAAAYRASGVIPLMLDADGRAMKRNFVHLDDLVEAMIRAIDHPAARQQLFNISMDEPVDYRDVASYLHRTRGLANVEISTEFHGTWLDNRKARHRLGWRPVVDLQTLIDRAWEYERAADDPRVVWYPG